MADTVSSVTMFDGTKKLVVHLTNRSDGTGESGVVKVDRDLLVGPNGNNIPGHLLIERIKYDCLGMRVQLYYDYSSPANTDIAILQGFGEIDFRDQGGLIIKGTGNTGDILLTTANQAAGDGYDITLFIRKKK